MFEPGGVTIDLPATCAAYLRRHTDLSWTKLQQFERCPANWLVENFAVVRDRKTQRQDHRLAFPGTIIQRVWEAAVNDAVFRRPGFDDPRILARWCADQARALYGLIVMPVDAQWERPQSSWRTYFATPEGEERRQDAITRHGLDPVFERHLQPQFVDEADIVGLYGSVERCLDYIGSRFELTMSALGDAGIMLDRIDAERYVAATDGQFRLAGQVDFLVRPQGADRLADGYLLIDGKFRIGPTVEIGQLYFYALLLERADGVAPGWLGFLDYGNGRLVGADGDGAYRLDRRCDLVARLARFEAAATSLADAMNTIKEDRSFMGLQEIPGIVFQPSRLACGFCSIGNCCEKSVAGRLAAIPAGESPADRGVQSLLYSHPTTGRKTDPFKAKSPRWLGRRDIPALQAVHHRVLTPDSERDHRSDGNLRGQQGMRTTCQDSSNEDHATKYPALGLKLLL